MDKIQSLKGMIDLIADRSNPDDFAESIFRTEDALKNIFLNFGYSEIRTPTLEDADLFKRSVGDSSDIVNKELYSFFDKNEKNITLRPENTAGVIREARHHRFFTEMVAQQLRQVGQQQVRRANADMALPHACTSVR